MPDVPRRSHDDRKGSLRANLSDVEIVYAQPSDVKYLTGLHSSLVGVPVAWHEHLGRGDGDDHLTLVAKLNGRIIGYLNWGRWIDPRKRTRTLFSYDDVPWTKLHALGVVPKHQGKGLAQALWSSAFDLRHPSTVGIFGNVDLSARDAIRWYRRRGLNVRPIASLALPGRSPMFVLPEAGPGALTPELSDLHFSATWQEALRYVDTDRTHDNEIACAEALFRADSFNGMESATDPGAVRYAHQVIAEARASCIHIRVGGPQPHALFAWDATRTRVCLAACYPTHAKVLDADTDIDNYACDICGSRDPQISSETVCIGTAVVNLGRCRACQRP